MGAALLLLADSRFPTGAHAHSAGVEAAVARGLVADPAGVEELLRGRLATVGSVDAAFAAAACAGRERWDALDAELTARVVSPRLRSVSRSLGRQLLRGARAAWPSPAYTELQRVHAQGPLQPLALGAVARTAGLDAFEAALCSLHHLTGAITTAAIRLLGLDPFAVHAIAAGLAPQLDELAAVASRQAHAPISELPSATALLGEILAEDHATWEVRLFAS